MSQYRVDRECGKGTYMKRWRRNNRDFLRLRAKEARRLLTKAQKETQRDKDRRRRRLTGFVNRARRKAWVKRNRKLMDLHSAKYYYKHRREILAKAKTSKARAVRRKSLLIHKYGMTPDQFRELLKQQGGGCAICTRTEHRRSSYGVRQRISVDHCHKTNRVRGILCSNCNIGISMFRDDPELLLKAIAYLRAKPPGLGNIGA